MVLVTGAGGKTGQAIISKLIQKDLPVRAWLGRPFIGFDQADRFVGDMENSANWVRACEGVEKIYFICPNMHPHEVDLGKMALKAAQQAGVQHFVYHSVLHPQTQTMAHHWNKLQVEEMIFASGLPFTILQPTAYMQNLLPQWDTVQKEGVMRFPYPAETAISLIDLEDLAEAACRVLNETTYIGSIIELVGTKPLTQTEVVEIISKKLKRPVAFEEVELVDWAAANAHLPTYTRETLLAMFRYYASNGLVGSPAVLSMLLGRQPCQLDEFFAKL